MSSYIAGCEPGCKAYDECTTEDKGLFADVKYFQMGFVDIPENVRENNLLTLTQQEDAEREIHLQEAQLIRKQTERIVSTAHRSSANRSDDVTNFFFFCISAF